MSVKPILFNTDMVRALLEGRKMVTRRAVKPLPELDADGRRHELILVDKKGMFAWKEHPNVKVWAKPPYQSGDILYVRETWAVHSCNDRLPPSIPCQKTATGRDCYIYLADGASGQTPCGVWPSPHKWRPSIHMPKEAARIFLRVKDVRVERLQDITDDDIIAEGLKIGCYFDELWNKTIKKTDRAIYGWEANPWVWAIEFEQVGREEALR